MQKTGRGLSSFSIDALIGHSKCLDAPSQGCGFDPREPVDRGDRADLLSETDHHSTVDNTPPCKAPPSGADLELHAFRLYRPPPSSAHHPSAKVDVELRRCINSNALSTEPMRKYCGGWAELLAKHNLQTSVLASATEQRWGQHPSQQSHRRRFDGMRDACSVEPTTIQRHSLLSSSHYRPVLIPGAGEWQKRI